MGHWHKASKQATSPFFVSKLRLIIHKSFLLDSSSSVSFSYCHKLFSRKGPILQYGTKLSNMGQPLVLSEQSILSMDQVFSQEGHVSSTYNVGAKFVALLFSSKETTEKGQVTASNMGHPYCLKRDIVVLPRIYLTVKQQGNAVIASSAYQVLCSQLESFFTVVCIV